jgi:hypothetical protein
MLALQQQIEVVTMNLAYGSLSDLLDRYLARDGRSLNKVAHAALIDVGYLWRLRAGTKTRPSRDVLIRLGLALRLEPEELDELLVAADYVPITLRPS